ncbi:uncharacterized protein LOC102710326 isoform X4 [Oryza brachyantha]|uniref:uncharacterized protein LOC102710326 isoform X4 n=1 Tax=Oryza brachyantha TaxID=4533 RepID=UPI0007761FED|nr:uncharacterized protein LOC102710326 isoform X4 [Oryza brachyantha]
MGMGIPRCEEEAAAAVLAVDGRTQHLWASQRYHPPAQANNMGWLGSFLLVGSTVCGVPATGLLILGRPPPVSIGSSSPSSSSQISPLRLRTFAATELLYLMVLRRVQSQPQLTLLKFMSVRMTKLWTVCMTGSAFSKDNGAPRMKARTKINYLIANC